MAFEVFVQRSRLGRRIFELRGHMLTISQRVFGKKREWVIDLRQVSPNFERRKFRHFRIIEFSLTIVVILGYCIKWSSSLPQGLRIMVIESCAALIVSFAFNALRFIKPMEAITFRDVKGKIRFDLVKETKQGNELEEFVTRVCKAIEPLSPNDPRDPTT